MITLYHPRVNFSFPGLSRFHPANLTKYRQAYRTLPVTIKVTMPRLRDCKTQLAYVHEDVYLQAALRGDGNSYALATEVPELRRAPGWLIRLALTRPMLAAVSMTIAAASLAWNERTFVFAIGGGFHHAKPTRGEGFCLFNDVAAAIQSLWRLPVAPSRVAYIDVDAHMGNGIAHCFLNDDRVKIFDLHMANFYPANDKVAAGRLDYGVALKGADTREYLYHLEECLPAWLKLVDAEIAFVNLGQDVLADDPLTSFALTPDEVRQRDLAVGKALTALKMPAVFVAGGGYTRDAGNILAASVTAIHGVAVM